MTEIKKDLIVVSDASTGLGAATAREPVSRGYHVLPARRMDRVVSQ